MAVLIALVVLIVVAAVGLSYLRNRPGASTPVVAANLPGPGTYEFDIVGESHYQETLESICGGRCEESAKHLTEGVLVLEDSNTHDNKAVRVDIEGKTVGYLSRDSARNYREQLRKLGHPNITCKCKAMVVGGWQRADGDTGSFGVRLDLPVA